MPTHLKNYTIVTCTSRLLILTACFVLIAGHVLKAQKYTFSHFNIEDGLVQSQVNKFSQDKSYCLWIGTLGGACRFDGHDFTSYSKQNGLANNFIYTVYCDSKNRVWFGSHRGVTCLNGNKLTNYNVPKNVKHTWVTHIVEDNAGTIWLTMDGKLFKAGISGLEYIPIDGVREYSVNAITVNRAGNLCVTVYQVGVYCLQRGQWISIIPFNGYYQKLLFSKVVFDKFNPNKAYLLSSNKLCISVNGVINTYQGVKTLPSNISLINLAQDGCGNLWIGSTNGAYYIKNNLLIHFDAHNGLTNMSVSDIYCDNDGNIWLATWGDGFYKYEGDAYVVFDQLQGQIDLKSVMGVVRDRQQNVLLATDGSGLIKYDGQNFKPVTLPTNNPNAKRIQCIYTDRDSNIWTGSSLGGLWKYDGRSYKLIPNSEARLLNAISQDGEGAIWIATPLGCFYYDNNIPYRVGQLNGFISSLLPLGKDSMIIGTQNGVKLAVGKKLVPNFQLKPINASNILCMLSYKGLVLFGTGDYGLFIWDKKSGIIKNYNVKSGFNSNSIYSLLASSRNTIWAGTGRGLNRIVINPQTLECTIEGAPGSIALIAEANQNSVMYNQGKLWMGTTKGLVIYNLNPENEPVSKPHIMMQSLKNRQNDKRQFSTINLMLADGVDIPYDQNHLNFSFLGVYLKDPAGVLYQYQLVGLDDKFCDPVKNMMVDYPSLPPGKYTFQVRAVTNTGIQSDNIATYSFNIVPPFYQTSFFKTLLLISFVLIGISIQSYVHKRKLQSINLIEQMKREEKQKIRKQTAEDFHDDLGNKLTRITILSDILSARIENLNEEQAKLINQIKQNAESVYLGTKDILWALDPKSDNLYEILIHIKNFGIELFHDTNIEFDCGHVDPLLKRIKLPMEYSRNLTMIYKELLNNILKHASASKVNLEIAHVNNNDITIVLVDNGKGFDQQVTSPGHGTNNIKNRAARINGIVDISSVLGVGTKVILNFKLKP